MAGSAVLVLSLALIVPSQAVSAGDPAGTAFELDGNANSSLNPPSFVNDGGRSASIFTGGGSRDIYDVTSWQWKNSRGLPDKDSLRNGFAGRYGDVLVFGSDRFDNSGDAMQGFWFFQDEVGLGAGGSFTGRHMPGDLLILSDFNVGGTVSIIGVYQ